jgi:hypothetical protein
VAIPQFVLSIYVPVDKYLYYFQFGAIKNKAVLNIHVWVIYKYFFYFMDDFHFQNVF